MAVMEDMEATVEAMAGTEATPVEATEAMEVVSPFNDCEKVILPNIVRSDGGNDGGHGGGVSDSCTNAFRNCS